MTEREKMHSGELYNPGDPEILKEQLQCQELQYEFNMTRPSEGKSVWNCSAKCSLRSVRAAT